MSRPRRRSKAPVAAGAHGGPHDDLGPTRDGRAVALSTEQCVGTRRDVEVILFGKVHRVTPREFRAEGEKYVRILETEWGLLVGELAALREAFAELRESTWVARTLAGWDALTEGWAGARGVGRGEGPPTGQWAREASDLSAGDFDAVAGALAGVSARFPPPDEQALHEVSVALNEARRAMDGEQGLRARLGALREGVVARAEAAGKAAEFVEDTTFQALSVAARLATLNPLQELAYRVGLMVLEGGARDAGVALADWSFGDPHRASAFLSEFLAIVRMRLPSILTDWLLRGLRSYLEKIGVKGRAEFLIQTLAQQFVEFHCDLLLLMWERRGAVTGDDLAQLVERRLYGAVAALLGWFLRTTPESKLVERLTREFFQAVVRAVASEAQAVRLRARDENIPFSRALVAQFPWFVARVAQNLLLGLLGQLHLHPAPPSGAAPAPPRRAATTRVRALMGRMGRPFQGTLSLSRLPPLSRAQFDAQFAGANLPRVVAEAMRRYCHERRKILAFRVSSAHSLRHVGRPGVMLKPVFVKAKTAKEGPLAGLVVKPRSPAELEALWSPAEVAKVKAAGVLVRDDGLLFHPAMIRGWARSRPELGDVEPLISLLQRAGHEGHFELAALRSGEGRRWWDGALARMTPEARASVERAWQRLQRANDLGYTGDVDLVELVDATSGRRVDLGTGHETGDEAAAVQDNLRRLNLQLAPLAGLTGEGKLPPGGTALHQHGGAAEARNADGTLQYPGLGDVAVVTPDGQIAVFRRPAVAADDPAARVRAEDEVQLARIEEAVRRHTGPAYRDAAQRDADPVTATPAAQPKSPPALRSKSAAALPRVEAPVEDPAATERAATARDLQASLVARGLVLVHPDNADLLAQTAGAEALRRLARDLARAGVVAALDPEQRAVVVATTGEGSVAAALRRLHAADDLLTAAGVTATRWWEVVAPVYLTTHGGVAGALPGGLDGLGSTSQPGVARLNVAQARAGLALRGLRAVVTAASFALGSDRCLGVRLDGVWVRAADRALRFEAVTLAGRPVVLLREPAVRFFSDPAEVPAVIAPASLRRYDLATPAGLRDALCVVGALAAEDAHDPAALEEAVRVFQASRLWLKVDGAAGPKTRDALREALAEHGDDALVGDAVEAAP